jgi:transcriptional regulator with GAF, ATPase, and Fis domain
MYQRKLMDQQIHTSGLRMGDSCSIFPFHGKKKAFTLNRHRIDLISTDYRPDDLSMSYIELPQRLPGVFHYRLELEKTYDKEGRYILKTISGHPFWLNGLAAREAYVERVDRLYIDDNKLNFLPFDLKEIAGRYFEHPVLMEQQLLSSDLKILINGETGTGKSHLAKMIHQKSGRAGEFVAINLSSFNSQLIESELFGHKKGAFTGAISDKIGAFSMASGGTLFLDEIDSLPLDLQTKLLTFLDNKKFRRVGDTREELINTRLLFASGRKLEKLVESGEFRKDLYYRLVSGHSLELTSLRNDPQKIVSACQHFSLTNEVSISARLVEFYKSLAWPGNLRQLFGHLEKKKILTRTTKIDFDQFDEELLLQSSDLMSFDNVQDIVPLDQVKADYIKKALAICDGNISLTARKLRLSIKTVRNVLQVS